VNISNNNDNSDNSDNNIYIRIYMNIYTDNNITNIKEITKRYQATNMYEPTFHLLSTILCIFILIALLHYSKHTNMLLILIPVLSLFLVRIFIIFHDLGHKSYFPTNERNTNTKGLNYNISTMIDFLNSYPADSWADGHSDHHKAQGNLDMYDNSRMVLTTEELKKLPTHQQILYKIFRHPIFFFTLVPLYMFWIARIVYFEYTYLIKYGLFLFVLYKVGKWKLVVSFILAQYIAGILGLMLFHLQHQVNPAYLAKFPESDKNSKANAELIGASVLSIPPILDYFTNGIEYHNVHHINPGVPSYNMRECYEYLVKQKLIPDTKLSYTEMAKGLTNTIYNTDSQMYM
jgi:acyl-lipid omega-6 desaturase (Delta-12 desaturase)